MFSLSWDDSKASRESQAGFSFIDMFSLSRDDSKTSRDPSETASHSNCIVMREGDRNHVSSASMDQDKSEEMIRNPSSEIPAVLPASYGMKDFGSTVIVSKSNSIGNQGSTIVRNNSIGSCQPQQRVHRVASLNRKRSLPWFAKRAVKSFDLREQAFTTVSVAPADVRRLTE